MSCLKLVFYFCFVCFVTTCELNLPEGSSCISEGLNGTCASVYRCPTAAFTYIYRNAGLGDDVVPAFPEVCTYKKKTPIVCCTDCEIGKEEGLKKTIVGYSGVPVTKNGPKALDQCMDYSQYLPYPCRGRQRVKITKVFKSSRGCHLLQYQAWLAVGGRGAERWEFPHMALLGYGEKQEDAQWHCGGSVISDRFILTAAHCLYSNLLQSSVTFAALGLLKRSDPLKYWKVYKIKRPIRHPEYKPPSRYHDIALLETETEINFGRNLLPACLDTVNTDINRYSADAAGWGELGHNNRLADTLQVVTIEEFNETDCSLHFPPIERRMSQGYNHTIQMCYGSHDRIVDTCRGDSGGPLQINKDNNRCQYTIIGVTSFGQRNCGIVGVPTIYTRVSYYVPWIESIVWPD